MMFRMTGDEKYLEHAENIADMLLSRLPVDGIPYWDFDAPNGNEYRDASAGAIMASAFVELSGFVTDEKTGQKRSRCTAFLCRLLFLRSIVAL